MKAFHGIVSAASPEAAKAGVDILEQGGNAVDAAVAVSFTIGVTEPAGSGIGGQGTFIIQKPNHVPFVVNGTSFSPAIIPEDVSLSELKQRKASTVPSQVMVLDFVHKNYGSGAVNWPKLLQPAIHFARQGYAIGEFRHKSLLKYRKALRNHPASAETFLLEDRSVPPQGSIIKNEMLAATLEQIGLKGAEDFYKGEVASAIAKDMKENGGWITARDLAEVGLPRILPALKGFYKGWDVATLPPPASGWAVLMALNILEQASAAIMSSQTPKRMAWLVQALKVIHRHRVTRPIQDLMNYEDMVAKKIGKEKADRIAQGLRDEGTGETTHFSVVDRDGMAVGVTQSLNSYFGSKVTHPTLGFFYNDYMSEFVAASRNNPFALKSKAMPYSSMSATILSKEAKPVLVLGSPANERIISAVIQVISHWVDLGEGIAKAVAEPRLHTISNEELMMEGKPDPKTLLAMEELGFSTYQPLSSLFTGQLNPYFGGVHAIAFEDGEWNGAADPRRDGTVIYAEQ